MKYFGIKTIRQALENNLNEKLKYIPSKINSMVCKEIDGVSIVDSALPSDTFNTVFGGKINEKICHKICSYYQQRRLPFAWWVLSNAFEAEKYLIKEGLTQEEEEIGMAYDLTQTPQKHEFSKQLTIRQCKTFSDFSDFSEVLASIFDPPDEQVKIFYQKMTSLRPDQIEKMLLFVGYEDQTPVATACLFFTDVAGIYDVSTKSEKRGHGYGSSMFHHMLDYARKVGYETAVLQASIEGINIYKRFGFKEVCKFNVWSKKF